MNPIDMTSGPFYTRNSPFPKHVLRFLYGGKVVTLVDRRGAQLDFQSDRYRSILSDIGEKFHRDHFSCAQLPLPSPSASPKPVRKTKRIPTTVLTASQLQSSPMSREIEDLSPVSSVYEPEMSRSPPQPSSQLLHFLHHPPSSHSKHKSLNQTIKKSYSLIGSPKNQSPDASQVLYSTRLKRTIPRFPKPTIARKCLGVGQDCRLGRLPASYDSKKVRASQVI